MRKALAGCLCLILSNMQAISAEPAKQPGHDESLYGKRLSFHKVENVGPCMAAEVAGDHLYAIGKGIFYALDITTPDKPRLLGKISGLGTTRQLFIKNNLAYVTARQDGMWLIDISDPAKPVLVSHYDTVEMATGIWVSGGLAFVATRCYGVEIVDVSDPHHPHHVSTLKTGEAQSCWARDGLLYIGDWAPRKLLVADIKNPREPVIIGEAPLDGYGDGGCLRSNICFASTGHHSREPDKEKGYGKGHGLELFDVSDPKKPVFLSRVKFPTLYSITNDMWGSRVAGDHCVAADTHNGLFVVNIHDTAKPVIVAHLQLPVIPGKDAVDCVGGVALAKDVIYAAGIFTGLYVVSAPGMASPIIYEKDNPPVLSASIPAQEHPDFHIYRPDGQVYSTTVQGDIAWTACGAAGLQAVKLGNKMEPVAIQKSKDDVCYASCLSNRVYTAEGKSGMAIYEIGTDLRLTELGRLTIPEQGVRQVMVPAPGHFALLHCGGASAYVVDLKDISKPRVVLKDSQVGLFYGDQLVDKLFDGRYLVAFWQRSGPAWYDIAATPPVLAGNTPDTKNYSWTDGACALGESLLIIKNGKYNILEPNEKRQVCDLPAYGINGTTIAGRPSTDGKTLAASSRHNRTVWTVDITNLKQPKLLRKYDLTGNPGACAFWNGRVVIPGGYQGLLLERQLAR